MENLIERFKVTDGRNFLLKNFNPSDTADLKRENAEAFLNERVQQITELQARLSAEKKHALLVVFQGMDASGKDGAIAHALSGLNPQGCEVFSFKQPSAEELSHDFLWRHYKALPQFGRIGIHNRSLYENVLVTRVHPDLLMNANLPGIKTVKDIDNSFWEKRFKTIRAFEQHLSQNGTVIIKFFLNLSKEEQKRRFLKRIEEAKKNWKFSAADINERHYFEKYMDAYEKAIAETASFNCPWYVIPADKKWFSRLLISSIIYETLKNLHLEYPVLPKIEFDKLEAAKIELLAEK